MEYKIEDLKFYNEKNNCYSHNDKRLGNHYIYNCENEMTQEEKIAFIDEHYERDGRKGYATYILGIIDKYLAEKYSIPKDSYGCVKKASLKAWLKRNDPRHVIDDHCHYGAYYFIGRGYSDFATKTPRPAWTSNVPYYNEDGRLVDLWFHDLLNDFYEKEKTFFEDHNSTILKAREVYKYGRTYGGFGIKKFEMVVGNGEKALDTDWCKIFNYEKVTEVELDEMLKFYGEVDKLMKSKKQEIIDRLGWEVLY